MKMAACWLLSALVPPHLQAPALPMDGRGDPDH
jgi:hypothetical protein